MKPTLAQIRRAVADYMESEGCSCCRDTDGHKVHTTALAKLLKVPQHPQEKGYYDFTPFRTSAKRKAKGER